MTNACSLQKRLEAGTLYTYTIQLENKETHNYEDVLGWDIKTELFKGWSIKAELFKGRGIN